MSKKEVIQVNLAAANSNLSPATRFGDLIFVAAKPVDIQSAGKSAETSVSRLSTPFNASR